MARELPKFSLERTFFWHGILMFNENGGHSIFYFSFQPSLMFE
jgi:hypothetical protein